MNESRRSRVEYIREVARDRHESDEIRTGNEAELERLQSELEQEQIDIERLRNEKQMLIADRQEKQELVKYVEEERSCREQPLRTRLRWWMFGKESD